FSGLDSLTYTLTDANGATDTATVTFVAPNDPPVAQGDSATLAEDGSAVLDVLANDSDPNGDPLSVTGVTQPTHGTAVVNGNGTITYTPDADYAGADSFTYMMTDGFGGTAQAVVSLTITPENDGPEAADDSASIAEDTATVLTVLDNDMDVEGDTLTITGIEGSVQAQSGTVSSDGTALTYTPDLGFVGTDSFSYTIADGNGGTSTAVVTVTVGNPNDPIAPGADLLTEGDDDVVLTSGADFVDGLAGDDVIAAGNGADVIHGNAGNDTLLGAKGSDALFGGSGDDSLDGGSQSDTLDGGAGQNILTGGKSADSFVISTLDGFQTLTDFDGRFGENLDVSQVLVGYVPGVSVLSDFVRFTPDGADVVVAIDANGGVGGAGFVDVARLQNYTIGTTDVSLLEASGALVTVGAVPVNAPPVAVDDVAQITGGGPVTVAVLANDSDPEGDALSVTAITQPTNGTAVLNGNGTLTYTPNGGFSGLDSLTYTLTDANGATDTATVTFDVAQPSNPADDDGNLALTASDLFVDVNDASAALFTVSGLDLDATGVVSVTDGVTTVTGTIVVDGTVTLDLSGLALGALSTSVAASDGTATATVVGPGVTLVAASADDDGNLLLSAPDLAIDGTEVDAVSLTVSGLDADASAVLTVSDGSAQVTGTLTADGTLALNLSALSDGPLITSITATDINGATTSQSGPALTLDTAPPSGDFTGETRALSINLAEQSYSVAARVMAFGDSLTLGTVNNDIAHDPALLEGYRNDLFQSLLSEDIWIDYVGRASAGPDHMVDRDHSGFSGERLLRVVRDTQSKIYDFDAGLELLEPDVVLFRMGTNDLYGNPSINNVETIVTNLGILIDQFYATVGSQESHLVISTVPPANRAGLDPNLASYLNEGYSMVAGQVVAGDAGNGTYTSGLKALVQAQQANHPTLHLLEDPTTVSDLSPDGVHLSETGYANYAAALHNLLDQELGFSGGTINGASSALAGTPDVTAGDAGDLVVGSSVGNLIDGGGGNDVLKAGAGADAVLGGAGDDWIWGGAGSDTLTGGAGGDQFLFAVTDFTGSAAVDTVLDFGVGTDRLYFEAGVLALNVLVESVAPDRVIVGTGDANNFTGRIVVEGIGVASLLGTPLQGDFHTLSLDFVHTDGGFDFT
ncbi:MAG: Ig-like domain-containing protein, partial [Pseudomonadota bacterium]